MEAQLPRASEINAAAKEIATKAWRTRKRNPKFSCGIAIHEWVDKWRLVDENRHFVKRMLRNDVKWYMKNAPRSLEIPNIFQRVWQGFVDGFDNTLEWIATH